MLLDLLRTIRMKRLPLKIQPAPAASYLCCNLNRQECKGVPMLSVIWDASITDNKLITPKASWAELWNRRALGRWKVGHGLLWVCGTTPKTAISTVTSQAADESTRFQIRRDIYNIHNVSEGEKKRVQQGILVTSHCVMLSSRPGSPRELQASLAFFISETHHLTRWPTAAPEESQQGWGSTS